MGKLDVSSSKYMDSKKVWLTVIVSYTNKPATDIEAIVAGIQEYWSYGTGTRYDQYNSQTWWRPQARHADYSNVNDYGQGGL